MAAERYALIILDGLGDRPHPLTEGKSPVDSARTPNLDRAASKGQMGEIMVIGPGTAPESDAGVFALLGYDPVHDSPGRGVLEAEGIGLSLAPGDVAFRLNFATTDGSGLVLDARVGRSLSTHESEELARALTAGRLLDDLGIEAEVRATVGHRGVLRLRSNGPKLSADVSNADPFYERVGGMGRARTPTEPRIPLVAPLDGSAEAQRTADAANLFLERAAALLSGQMVNARRALAGRKVANGLLLRNAGTPPSTPPVTWPERWGMAGAAVTEMPVERGIAQFIGLADRYLGPMGPDRDAGYRERAAATTAALAEFPFVYVHLKGPDEPGHDGDAVKKREVIEAIDQSFFGPFFSKIDPDQVRVAVTADHATPCVLKGHSDDPVPLLLTGSGVAGDPSAPVHFGGEAAAKGALGRRMGSELMPLLLGHAPTDQR
jgi:2,3-bisphosphoglycerate-independent phosphoglycerate mutase